MFSICFFIVKPSVSHVLYSLRERQSFISGVNRQQIQFNSRFAVPLPKFGFLACGVYRVSAIFVQYGSSLWHFMDTLAFYIHFSAVTCWCLNLFVRLAQSLQASQPVLAWTFLTPKCSIARWSDTIIISYLTWKWNQALLFWKGQHGPYHRRR